MIFDRHANLKYKYGSRHFWAKGYFVDTVGKNEQVIKEYIQNHLQEDKLYDQMSLKEFIDPFTGEQVKGGKKENLINIIYSFSSKKGRIYMVIIFLYFT